MISFLRPVMRRQPSSSSSPRSPVRNQPSPQRLGGGRVVVVVAGEDLAALDQDLAVVGDRIETPGSGRPTVPILIMPGVFTVEAAVVSVRP